MTHLADKQITNLKWLANFHECPNTQGTMSHYIPFIFHLYSIYRPTMANIYQHKHLPTLVDQSGRATLGGSMDRHFFEADVRPEIRRVHHLAGALDFFGVAV